METQGQSVHSQYNFVRNPNGSFSLFFSKDSSLDDIEIVMHTLKHIGIDKKDPDAASQGATFEFQPTLDNGKIGGEIIASQDSYELLVGLGHTVEIPSFRTKGPTLSYTTDNPILLNRIKNSLEKQGIETSVQPYSQNGFEAKQLQVMPTQQVKQALADMKYRIDGKAVDLTDKGSELQQGGLGC